MCLVLVAFSGSLRAQVPSGFADSLVTAVSLPTGLTFTPDGRMLITTQPGRLRVVAGGSLLSTPALDLSALTCSNSERGLLGVAVDPAFVSNHFIYVYYTFKKFAVCNQNAPTSPVNRVSRFVLPATNVVDPASETVLLDNIPSPNGNHNGGDVQFGKDGYLYVSVGDGGCDYKGVSGCGGGNDAARDTNVLLGKVLRIGADGSIPPTNPFLGAGTVRCNQGNGAVGTKCQETFAWGLRNPFRIAFDPNAAGARFYINDVGQDTWEEIDLALAGADYGWNVREGPCATGSTTNCGPPPAGMTNPIFSYSHFGTVPGTSQSACEAITAGAFVPNGIWPSSYDGAYLFGDFVCGAIFKLTPSLAASDFDTNLGSNSLVHLAFGPFGATQALYYTTYGGGGQVRRVAFTGSLGTCSPTATTLCLNASRFRASVSFRNYNDGSTGAGQAVAVTSETGYFWFFNASNVELMIKALDGRAANGKFWVLYGALSDVEYTITVNDTATGATKSYYNPAHRLASAVDISAF